MPFDLDFLCLPLADGWSFLCKLLLDVQSHTTTDLLTRDLSFVLQTTKRDQIRDTDEKLYFSKCICTTTVIMLVLIVIAHLRQLFSAYKDNSSFNDGLLEGNGV